MSSKTDCSFQKGDIMQIIAFIDADFGLSLNHRRICRDKYAVEHMCNQFAQQTITLTPSSARYVVESLSKLGLSNTLKLHVVPNFQHVSDDDILFIEDGTGDELNSLVSRATRITLFLWDNTHIHDTTFPAINADKKWQLSHTISCGTPNHPNMIGQVYIRKPQETYRIILGAAGDDYIRYSGLSYEEAREKFERTTTAPGVYKRIEKE